MLTEEELKRLRTQTANLEEQVGLERRFDDANNQRIVNMDMRGVNREQARNDAWHEANMRARARRLEARAEIARTDPGRFSPFERNALLGLQHTKQGDIPLMDRQERGVLRQHELNMLEQQGKNELAVAEQKRFGMAEQGRDAARIAAEAKLDENKRRFGQLNDDGTYVPGSDVHAAKANGLSRAEVEMLKGQNRLAVAEANNDTKREIAAGQNETKKQVAAGQNETKKQVAAGQAETQKLIADERNKAILEKHTKGLDKAIAKDIETAATNIMKTAAFNGNTISFEDAINQVKQQRGIVTDDSGRNKVKTNWKGGDIAADKTGAKWEIVRDANGKPIGKRRVQ